MSNSNIINFRDYSAAGASERVVAEALAELPEAPAASVVKMWFGSDSDRAAYIEHARIALTKFGDRVLRRTDLATWCALLKTELALTEASIELANRGKDGNQ